ncbi:hypothetical protein EXU48_01330 [Occultella glacieicola]|uniref:Uncharacterized protein n=1 Tax=Occultella glacieicola TaxID=2518684 RepID=A0ABY2EA96_9MICO|nr:hypothetical protein [Occultella glacieicola]TDE98871.1 hypothetical protein EXU48_01330 [Occultella glacieicola]
MDRWETFHSGRSGTLEHDGAVHRLFDDLVLRTRIAFPIAGAEYLRAESVVRFAHGARTWETSTYRAEPEAVRAQVDRVSAGLDTDTMPSYGEFLLLADLIASGEPAVRYIRLEDSDPVDGADRATLERQRPERVTPPGGTPVEAQRYGVVVDREQIGTHWVVDGRVRMSDWNGPVSVHVDSAGAALVGLPEAVVTFLREGFESADPRGKATSG